MRYSVLVNFFMSVMVHHLTRLRSCLPTSRLILTFLHLSVLKPVWFSTFGFLLEHLSKYFISFFISHTFQFYFFLSFVILNLFSIFWKDFFLTSSHLGSGKKFTNRWAYRKKFWISTYLNEWFCTFVSCSSTCFYVRCNLMLVRWPYFKSHLTIISLVVISVITYVYSAIDIKYIALITITAFIQSLQSIVNVECLKRHSTVTARVLYMAKYVCKLSFL